MNQKPAPATKPTGIKAFLKAAGPGIVTGAADDDPSGIGTYTVTGAQFGPAFLWTAWLTWPLMGVVQMACARVGMATGHGLARALKKKFPRAVLALACFALFIANTLNVGADLAAMGDCTEMLIGGKSWIYVAVFGLALAYLTVKMPYEKMARVLKWLSLFLFAYIVTAFLVVSDWGEVLKVSFMPALPQGKEQWAALVAILGTTISPYLFFWQASQEVEEKECEEKLVGHKIRGVQPGAMVSRGFDVGIGTFFSNIVMYFIILAAWLTLNKHGLTKIETSREAAQALVPIAGRFASLLYSVGLLGVGFLAIPTLTGSAGYALAETFGWNEGLNHKFDEAKAFYAVILVSTVCAILLDFSGVNPIRALYGSAIVNGALAPFFLLGLFLVIRDKVLMRGSPSPKWAQGIVAITMLLMFAALFAMLAFG